MLFNKTHTLQTYTATITKFCLQTIVLVGQMDPLDHDGELRVLSFLFPPPTRLPHDFIVFLSDLQKTYTM